ncbi:MAG: HlyD family secretion protein [Bacteroidales bacterium]
MKAIHYLLALVMIISITSCGNSNGNTDATGVFEATEIIVSSEANGKILELNVNEGDELKKNQLIAVIDSTQLYLKKLQLEASAKGVRSRNPNVRVQIAATQQQLETARSEKKRIENLVNANAINSKQLDDINAQVLFLEKQLAAQKETLENTSSGIDSESEAINIQIAQIADQLYKCRILSPIDGTVLVKYAEQSEFAVTGKAILKMADTEQMFLRAYVTADQLTKIKIGQKVKVLAESGEDDSREYEGMVTWISDKSEFTPKTIQTQDERANLVYAIKVAVKNDGFLKIGMYGGIVLGD